MQPCSSSIYSIFYEKTNYGKSSCLLVCDVTCGKLCCCLFKNKSLSMNWFSHRVFAVGLAAVCKFDIVGVAASYFGSTIPDSIDFFLTKIGFDFNRIHRKHSHAWIWYALLIWGICAFIFPFLQKYYHGIIQYQELVYAFFLGIFSHIFADMLTVKGVPLFINPSKKIAVKLVKTNGYSEQFFTFLFFVTVCFYLYFTKNPVITSCIEYVHAFIISK